MKFTSTNRFCVPIVGPSLKDIQSQLALANGCAHMIEWRVDLWKNVTLAEFFHLRSEVTMPCLSTLRSASQGGRFNGGRDEYVQLVSQLAKANPEYLDIEAACTLEQFHHFREAAPEAKIIVSWHDLVETPQDLNAIVQSLRALPGDIYKLATFANSAADALRIVEISRRLNATGGAPWICLGMGEQGLPSRVLGPVSGAPFTFASLGDAYASAAGQLSLATLLDPYHVDQLNLSSCVMALLGDPVDKSIGHLWHNRLLVTLGLNGVYFKMRTPTNALSETLAQIRRLPFLGLSVTMPLKEAILPYLDEMDASAMAMGAVNTVVMREGQLIGYNTDGPGALNAIEKIGEASVQGARMVVLGAGGTARAIAWEAQQRGAEVVIFNRSEEKAHRVAADLGCRADTWSNLPKVLREACDVFVQATSVGMEPHEARCPIDTSDLQPKTLVFDVVTKPRETRLLREAAVARCRTVSGMDMFLHQAILQLELWFGPRNLRVEDILKQLREVSVG